MSASDQFLSLSLLFIQVVVVHRSAEPVEVKVRPVQAPSPRVVPIVKRTEPSSRSEIIYDVSGSSSAGEFPDLITRSIHSRIDVPKLKQKTIYLNRFIPAILEIPSLGDELLNGSDTSSKEVVINGRTYSIQNIAGQHMFVDVLTQQKLLPVQQGGELTLIDVLEEQVEEADINKPIEVRSSRKRG